MKFQSFYGIGSKHISAECRLQHTANTAISAEIEQPSKQCLGRGEVWHIGNGTPWAKTQHIANTHLDRAQHHHTKHMEHRVYDIQYVTNRDIQAMVYQRIQTEHGNIEQRQHMHPGNSALS